MGYVKAILEFLAGLPKILGYVDKWFTKSTEEKAGDAVNDARNEVDEANHYRPPKLRSIALIGLGLAVGQGCATAKAWFFIDPTQPGYAIDPNGKEDRYLADACPVAGGKYGCVGLPADAYKELTADLARCQTELKDCQKNCRQE